MQRRGALIALLAALSLAIPPLTAANARNQAPPLDSRTLTVGVPDAMPLSGFDADGRPRGILLDATIEALRRMGYDTRFVPLPMARLYAAVMQDGADGIDVAVSVQATPERRGRMHFAPTMVMEYLILAAPWRSGYSPRTIGDLRGHVIGGRTGVEYPGLDDLPDLYIKRTRSDRGNARMAIGGRVAGFLMGSVTGVWELRATGQMPTLAISPVAFGSIPLTVALNRHRFSAEKKATFDRTVKEIVREPVWQDILRRNEATDLLTDWPVVYE